MSELLPANRTNGRRRWKMRLVAGGLGVVVGLIVMEVALRVVGLGYFLPYQPDEYCGTRLMAGVSGRYHQEGNAWVTINSHGNRDVKVSKEKSSGTVRIAVLGDSYAEAMQVDVDETFWKLCEARLNAPRDPAGTQYEVLNFGVSGYGTAQELQMLKHYVVDFDPDIVLLAMLTGNDIADNSPLLSGDTPRPYFRWEGGSLVLDDSFLSHPVYEQASSGWTRLKVGLINRSYVLQVLNHYKTQWQSAPVEQGEATEAGLNAEIYHLEDRPAWREAWQVTRELVGELNRQSQNIDAKFCVVCLSNGIQVHPDANIRRQFQQREGISDLYLPDKRVARWCSEMHAPCLLLAPKMGTVAIEKGTYFHGFANTTMGVGHWNESGHAFAAEEIADWLSTQVLTVKEGKE